MPDKEGSDDEKTTKGVVKKKTKQMLNQEYIPEEEYDRYRDNILMRGGDHRSKETRERSNTPTGKQSKGKTVYQKQAEKKYGKGKSALDMVKADITAKYGKGAIMNVKKKSKKKANEELDLTKIAEAFGGYIVEAKSGGKSKSNKNQNQNQNQEEPPIRSGTTDSDPSFEAGFRRTKAFKQLNPDAKAGKTRTTFSSGAQGQFVSGSPDMANTDKQFVKGGRKSVAGGEGMIRDDDPNSPTFAKMILKPSASDDFVQKQEDDAFKQTTEYQQAKATGKKITAGGGLAKEKQFDTETKTKAEFEKDEAERKRKRSEGKGDGRKAGRTKEEKRTGNVTYKTFVNKPEVTQSQRAFVEPPPQSPPDKVTQSQTAFVEPPPSETKKRVKRVKPKKQKVIVKEPETQTKTETEPQTQTAVGGGGRRGGPKVTTSGGAFSGKEPSLVSKVAKFSKENPATALLSLDALRRFMPSSSPFGVSGGRVGRRSAPS